MDFFNDMKVSRKLGVLILISLLAMSIIGYTGYYYLQQANVNIKSMYADRLIPVKLTNEIHENTLRTTAATLELIAIGVFNENFSPTHYAVSVAFFVLMPISMFVITSAFLLKHQSKMAIFTVLIGILAALPWVLLFAFNYASNVAIPEFLSGLAISIWTVTLSYKIFKQNKE